VLPFEACNSTEEECEDVRNYVADLLEDEHRKTHASSRRRKSSSENEEQEEPSRPEPKTRSECYQTYHRVLIKLVDT
jgi:hypothetical protein